MENQTPEYNAKNNPNRYFENQIMEGAFSRSSSQPESMHLDSQVYHNKFSKLKGYSSRNRGNMHSYRGPMSSRTVSHSLGSSELYVPEPHSKERHIIHNKKSNQVNGSIDYTHGRSSYKLSSRKIQKIQKYKSLQDFHQYQHQILLKYRENLEHLKSLSPASHEKDTPQLKTVRRHKCLLLEDEDSSIKYPLPRKGKKKQIHDDLPTNWSAHQPHSLLDKPQYFDEDNKDIAHKHLKQTSRQQERSDKHTNKETSSPYPRTYVKKSTSPERNHSRHHENAGEYRFTPTHGQELVDTISISHQNHSEIRSKANSPLIEKEIESHIECKNATLQESDGYRNGLGSPIHKSKSSTNAITQFTDESQFNVNDSLKESYFGNRSTKQPLLSNSLPSTLNSNTIISSASSMRLSTAGPIYSTKVIRNQANYQLYLKIRRYHQTYFYPRRKSLAYSQKFVFIERKIGNAIYYENLEKKLFYILPDYEKDLLNIENRSFNETLTGLDKIESVNDSNIFEVENHSTFTSLAEMSLTQSLENITQELRLLTEKYAKKQNDSTPTPQEKIERVFNHECNERYFEDSENAPVVIDKYSTTISNAYKSEEVKTKVKVDETSNTLVPIESKIEDKDESDPSQIISSINTHSDDVKEVSHSSGGKLHSVPDQVDLHPNTFNSSDAAICKSSTIETLVHAIENIYQIDQMSDKIVNENVSHTNDSTQDTKSTALLKKQLKKSISLNQRLKAISSSQALKLESNEKMLIEKESILQKLNRIVEMLQMENKDLKAQIEELNEDIDVISQDRTEQDNRIKQLIHERNVTLSDLKKNFNESQSYRQKAASEIQSLRQSCAELLNASKRSNELKDEVSYLQERIESLQNANTKLLNQETLYIAKIEELSNIIQSLKKENSSLKTTIDTHTTKISHVNKDLTSGKSPKTEIKVHIKEYNKLKEERDYSNQKLIEQEKKLHEATCKIAELKDSEQNQSLLLKEKEKDLVSLHVRLDEFILRDRRQKEEIYTLSTKCDHLSKEIERLKVEFEANRFDLDLPPPEDFDEDFTESEQLDTNSSQLSINKDPIDRTETNRVSYLELTEKQEFILNELLDTERFYVKSLKLLLNVYGSGLEPYMEADDYNFVFSSTENIYYTNKAFLKQLEDIYSRRDYIQIPKLFLQFSPIWKLYSNYILRYDDIMIKFQQLKDTNKRFADKEHEIEKELKSTGERTASFKSYGIMPVQRIPRYIMLLKDLQKKSPQNDFVNELAIAVDLIENLARFCNDSKEKRSNKLKLQELEEKLGLRNFSHVEGRKFEKEGVVTVDEKQCKIYLFSDILLLDQSPKKIHEIDLQDPVFSISAIPNKPMAFKIELSRLELECICSSSIIAQSWIQKVKRRQLSVKPNEEVIIYEGVLRKQGDSRSTLFRKRHHVLSNYRMRYYNNGKLKGGYSIQNCKYGLHMKAQFGFTIQTETRLFILKAESDQEVDAWMEALAKVSGAIRVDPEKQCQVCGKSHPKASYSLTQWKKPNGKCKNCDAQTPI